MAAGNFEILFLLYKNFTFIRFFGTVGSRIYCLNDFEIKRMLKFEKLLRFSRVKIAHPAHLNSPRQALSAYAYLLLELWARGWVN